VEGDNLDVTVPEVANQVPNPPNPDTDGKVLIDSEPEQAGEAVSTKGDGFGMFTKLFLLGAIVAICALFVRRAAKGRKSYNYKSMA
jgi:hypothetical protein